MQRTVSVILSLFLVLIFVIPAAEAAPDSTLQLFLDGNNLHPSVPPRIVKQSTMVPGRVISQALGAQVEWNASGRSVTITRDQSVLLLSVNKTSAFDNGKSVELDQAPILEQGSVLLPLRFIAEHLGILVRWDKPTRSINLWTSDTQVSGSDPAADPAVPAIPGGEYPVLQNILFVNNQLVVKASGAVSPQVFTLSGPDRLVIDIPGLRFGQTIPEPAADTMGEITGISSSDALMSKIRYSMYAKDTSTIRIVADLKYAAGYQVVNSGDQNSLIVHLTARDEAAQNGSAVLIYQSHSRESFLSLLPGVTNPNLAFHPTRNIGLLGGRMAQNLQDMGNEVYHATDDYPSIYGGSYSQGKSYIYSEKTVRREMALHPQIRYLFDLHRDSSSRASTTVNIAGRNYAKLYFVIGLENPDWRKNDAFAKKIQSLITARYPGISRGIYYKDRSVGNGWYNQNLSNRSALIEIGGAYNTLTESNRTIDVLSNAIHQLIKSGY